MRIAVLGGSFNPIHIGHLHLADTVINAFGFDRLLLVPANISPFKAPDNSASPADRLDMILASITGNTKITAEDMELRRGGVSYTIDTIREIIDRYHPDGKPALILGDDLTADFCKWKDAEELARITDIIIARRMINAGQAMPEFPYPHVVLNNEVMDISSAMIRNRIAGKTGNSENTAGSQAWHYLVPQGARFIIESRGLYRDSQHKENEITSELIARVEEEARTALSAKRFIHSRNTALMARDIAIRYNLDADAAYLAGIAHDMAKKHSTDLEHGKDAAVLLQKRFGIHNKDVLEAIKVHTTGMPRMGDVAKVVFIADKIEFSRPGDHNKHRSMAGGNGTKASSLDELFYAVFKDTISWLKEAGIKVSKKTLRLLEEK